MRSSSRASVGAAQAARDAAGQFPGLVVAALAQPRGAQRHRQQPGRAAALAAPHGVEQALRQHGGQVERGVELEARDQARPRGARSRRAATRALERRRLASGRRRRPARRRARRCAQRRQRGRGAAKRARHRRRTAAAAPSRGRPRTGWAGAAARRGRARRPSASPQYTAPRHVRRRQPRAPPLRRARSTRAAVAAALRRMARAADSAVAARARWRGAWPSAWPIIRLQPATVLDWWGCTGASGGAAGRRPIRRRGASSSNRRRRCCGAAAARRAGPVVVGAALGVAGAPRCSARRRAARRSAQLLWANMMLHAVTDPPALFARWQRALAVDGFVMFSCLGPGTLRELRALYGRLGWPPPTPDFVDMHDLGDMLVQAGFADPVMDQETLTLHLGRARRRCWPSCAASAATPRPARRPGCARRAGAAAAARSSTRCAAPTAGSRLSFEVVYGHAFKAAPRCAAARQTTVSLDDMRAMVRRPGAPEAGGLKSRS